MCAIAKARSPLRGLTPPMVHGCAGSKHKIRVSGGLLGLEQGGRIQSAGHFQQSGSGVDQA